MSNVQVILLIGSNKVSFWLEQKEDVDVIMWIWFLRLLVTYAGQGTELLPDYAANKNAFREGKSNKEILKSLNQR